MNNIPSFKDICSKDGYMLRSCQHKDYLKLELVEQLQQSAQNGKKIYSAEIYSLNQLQKIGQFCDNFDSLVQYLKDANNFQIHINQLNINVLSQNMFNKLKKISLGKIHLKKQRQSLKFQQYDDLFEGFILICENQQQLNPKISKQIVESLVKSVKQLINQTRGIQEDKASKKFSQEKQIKQIKNQIKNMNQYFKNQIKGLKKQQIESTKLNISQKIEQQVTKVLQNKIVQKKYSSQQDEQISTPQFLYQFEQNNKKLMVEIQQKYKEIFSQIDQKYKLKITQIEQTYKKQNTKLSQKIKRIQQKTKQVKEEFEEQRKFHQQKTINSQEFNKNLKNQLQQFERNLLQKLKKKQKRNLERLIQVQASLKVLLRNPQSRRNSLFPRNLRSKLQQKGEQRKSKLKKNQQDSSNETSAIIWVDPQCFYYSKLSLLRNLITNKRSGYSDVFGRQTVDKNFTVIIQNMKNSMGIGIVNQQYRTGKFGPHLIYLNSSGKCFVQGNDSITDIKLAMEDKVKVSVNFQTNQIQWTVNQIKRHSVQKQIIQNKTIKWVPYILMGSQGDCISILQ